VPEQGDRAVGEVLGREQLPHLAGGHLAAAGVRAGLDRPGELDLQPPGQVELVLGLHHVRDAALAGLSSPGSRLVCAAHVARVDRQVRDSPGVVRERDPGRLGFRLQGLEALLDRVLVGAENAVYTRSPA